MTGFRALVMVLSCGAIGTNLVLLIAGWRNRQTLVLRSLIVWYPLAAMLTSCLILAYRLSAAVNHQPADLRDYTALLPTVSFLIAGTVGLRALGRVVGKHDLEAQVEQAKTEAEDA